MNTLSASQYNKRLKPYVGAGVKHATELGNRGPLKLGDGNKLAPDILNAFRKTGFYVFEGLIEAGEIGYLQADIKSLLERAPVDNGAIKDRLGRSAFGQEFARPVYSMIRPLSDPWGGTDKLNGRHPIQMTQPTPEVATDSKNVFLMSGMCQIMESGLRLYGHPQLLAIAASINGDDFVPFNDAIFVKEPGIGGSVAWHQDGVTHWESADWDESIHGFNFQVQLYDTSAQSCLWVIPGSHKLGKIDIEQLVADNGSELLPNAVPLHARAGDVTIVNRQALHGSFANTSSDQRISLTFGFHRRKSVLGARGSLSEVSETYYDETRIDERSQVIGVAIDARGQFYPSEKRFSYQPMNGREHELRCTSENWQKIIRDYNLKDLAI